MEAIWKIEVEDFPAFILVDDKGNDFLPADTTHTMHPLCEINRAALRGGFFYMARKTKHLLSNGK
ncbi:tartrate/fumarate subfamily Fe-S type hydro-lyase subunit beta [Escherichia coli]|nr:tartrate/fumarate subfamily Fe-S type hydro-lyase subunit beta [Escherichia coli]